jgi:protein TonB
MPVEMQLRMKSASPLAALAATALLHAAAIAAAIIGFSSHEDKPAEPLPIAVQLLPPPASVANTSPAPLPVAPAAPPEKKRAEPKPVAKPKPPEKPRPSTAPQPKVHDVPREPQPAAPAITEPSSTPAPSVAAAQPSPPAPPAPPTPPAPPAPPAKTAASIPATYAASNRKPDYPSLSRRYEEQGTVVLRIFVKADGTAGDVQIKSSSGYPLLDTSARTTVQSWRFNPATSDGKPIAEWYQVSIPFKLQN